MKYKIGDRVRNTGHGYSPTAKDGTVVKITRLYARVKFDDYETLRCTTSDIALIKEREVETKKLYKVVHDGSAGLYSSVYAGQPCDPLGSNGKDRVKLTYQIGQITVASKGSDGIYCYEDFEKAKEHAEGKAGFTIENPTAILEVEAVTIAGDKARCSSKPRAVQVISEIWASMPKPPTEKEQLQKAKELLGGEIETISRISLKFTSNGKMYRLYFYRQEVFPWVLYKDGDSGYPALKAASLDEVKAFLAPKPKFKKGDRVMMIHKLGVYAKVTVGMIGTVIDASNVRSVIVDMPACHGYYVQGKFLELAPPLEWVDVTKECTLNWNNTGNSICVMHSNAARVIMGATVVPWCVVDGKFTGKIADGNPSEDYKIERVKDGLCGTIKILHLQ